MEIPPIAGKTASIDIIEINQATHMMYVTDRGDKGLDVFDVSTPTAKYVTTIKTSDGPNGVSVAANVNKVFAGLNNSHVAIIDIDPKSAKVNTVITELDTGGKKRADEMDYDPKDKKLYVANSDDGIVTSIDAVNNKILKKFDNLGPGLEQPRYNPSDGMMYMSGSEDNVIFQFDPTTDTMVKKFDVVDPCHPNGLAINPKTNQAILGCSNQKQPQHTALWDLKAGKVIATFDQIGSGDAVIYDAKADRFIFAANHYYRGGAMGIFSGSSPVKFITNVPTGNSGAHGVAYDETNKMVYGQDQSPNAGALIAFALPDKSTGTAGSAPASGAASAKPAASSKPSAS